MNPESQNFLQKKMLQEDGESKSEEERFETGLRDFIKETGVPVEIKEIRFATPEERQQAKVLREKIEAIDTSPNPNFEIYKEVLLIMLEYVDQAIVTDNLTDPDDDKIRDDQIEKVLEKRSLDTNSTPELRKKYEEIHSGYTKSKLHRNLINAGVNYFDHIFKDDTTLHFSAQTQELADVLHQALKPVEAIRTHQVKLRDEAGEVRMGDNGKPMLGEPEEIKLKIPAYDFMSEDQKAKVAEAATAFNLSCVKDVIETLESQVA